MFWHARKETHGVLFWWHFSGPHRPVFKVEFHWWWHSCLAEVSVDDEGWSWALAFPPFFLALGFDGFPAWVPKRLSQYTNPPALLTEARECRFAIHDWTLWFTPWGRTHEWNKRDPWWVRGVHLDLKDLFLGQAKYTRETLRTGIMVKIPMPEGTYTGYAKIERQTWKRPRWLLKRRISTWIDVPKGIPFSGKGENSWDCGDDGLFGCGVEGEDVHKAVLHYMESVQTSRRKYGMPSGKAIEEALA